MSRLLTICWLVGLTTGGVLLTGCTRSAEQAPEPLVQTPPLEGERGPPLENNGPAAPQQPPDDDGMLLTIDRDIQYEDLPTMTQEALREGEHVRFAGDVSGGAYSGALILRVTRAPGSTTAKGLGWLVVHHPLEQPGPFELVLPTGEDLLVLEILADANDDGQPTKGEQAVLFLLTGELSPDKDREALELALPL